VGQFSVSRLGIRTSLAKPPIPATAPSQTLAVISIGQICMRLSTIILIIFLLSSCGDKVERERLPGRYAFTHWTKDTIDINDNGTYRHFTFRNGRRFENSGTWKLNSIGTEIQFENFSFLTDSMASGNWFSRLRTDGQEIHLMYADDINAYYSKVSELDSLK